MGARLAERRRSSAFVDRPGLFLVAKREAWEAAVNSLGLAVADARCDPTTPLRVNVVLRSPASYTDPDFEAARTGRFNARTKRLLVQAAVPATLVADQAHDPDSTVRALLALSIDEAEAWAQRMRLADNLESLRAIVQAVEPHRRA